MKPRAKRSLGPCVAASAVVVVVVWLVSIGSASADIITGLMAHWTLDETSGSTAYDSAGSNDAQLSGFLNDSSTWVPGKIGGSLNFSTSSSYVLTDAPIVSNQYTIAFWLKVNGPGGVNPRLVAPRDGYESWAVINDEYDRGVGFYYDDGAELLQDPNPPTAGVWEHYATTLDLIAQEGAVYRNGVLVAAGSYSDNVPQLRWVFGHNQDPANHNDTLNGQLDDIRIYNRVLSQGDIQELVAIPEPSSLVLTALCTMGLAARRARRTRAKPK